MRKKSLQRPLLLEPERTPAVSSEPLEINLAMLLEAVASRFGDRTCLVDASGPRTWRETHEQVARFAALLRSWDIGRHGLPEPAHGWQCNNDRVALLLTNCATYLETMVGSWRAGATAVNVNYRYVAEELQHVLTDSGARVIVFHGRFGPVLAEVSDDLPALEHLLQVDDGSPLLDDARFLDEALLSVDPADAPAVAELSPADRYVLYTGGTTGLPKGVLWRQSDFAVAALGLRRRDGTEYENLEEVLARAEGGTLVTLPAAPFMHGAAHWNALAAWCAGGTVVLPEHPERFDAGAALRAIERHGVTALLVVGDAFARPLLEALERSTSSFESLRHLLNGGAALSDQNRARLLARLPGLTIVDVLGSSESGRQAVRDQRLDEPGRLWPSAQTVVVSADRSQLLREGDQELGWLAQSGRVPCGYLGDPSKTADTFPTIEGTRYAVPGDRVRWRADGSIELHGRDSATINTGGEKVFAEEVEAVLRAHPAVVDAVVVGRDDPRWGQAIVAVLQVVNEDDVDDEVLLEHCAQHPARYKLPKTLRRVPAIQRSPAGKADYRWAKAVAMAPNSAPIVGETPSSI